MKYRLIIFLFILSSLTVFAQNSSEIIHHKRQFRGVWIASVRNLDWPSKQGLSVRKIKKEYIRQLDLLKDLGMNAVIVQIRPIADAFYPSDYEPWSEFLSGTQGIAPKNDFDPLAFMISETHKRSMEFHAWFNPYRAARTEFKNNLTSSHAYNTHPAWFVEYGKDIYFDPGIEHARKFVEKVIADVVTRYDIDAVHFDDYYYPYRLEGIEFPDSLSFANNSRGYDLENKDDWRRDNVNLLVSELYDIINSIKPWVHFGISPFGVWRNKSQDPDGSDTETLQTNYDDLFGDSQAWVKNGWLDYILPQCYQYLGRDIMDYRVVTKWWSDHNHGVNFYIGQGPFRLGNAERGEPWTEGNEIDRQMYFNDSIPNLLGSAYFRSKTFFDNPLGVNDSLRNKFYAFQALPPASNHDKDKFFNTKINNIVVDVKKRKVEFSWQVENSEQVRYYVIYKSEDLSNPENIITVTSTNSITFKRKALGVEPTLLRITAVDRYRKESQSFKLLDN